MHFVQQQLTTDTSVVVCYANRFTGIDIYMFTVNRTSAIEHEGGEGGAGTACCRRPVAF